MGRCQRVQMGVSRVSLMGKTESGGVPIWPQCVSPFVGDDPAYGDHLPYVRTYHTTPSAATHWVPLSALPPHADPTALADKMVALSTYLSRNNSSGKRRDKTKKKGAAQALSRNIHAMLGAHYGTGRGYNKQLCDTDDEEEEEEGGGGGGRNGRVSSTQTAVLHEPQKRGFGAKGCLTGAGSLGGGGGALSVRVLSRLGGR